MSKSLKDFGFIAYFIERFFRFLQFLPPWVILSNRPDYQNDSIDKKDLLKKTKKRALYIDYYIFTFIVVEILSIILIYQEYFKIKWMSILILTIAILRIVDIIQVNINMVLFDHLRLSKNKHYMASAVRTIINNFINYFELIICFGIIYSFNIELITGTTKWMDGFYLSISSQLNINLADLSPMIWNKLIFTLQGLIGFFFGLLIFARIISILPHIKSVLVTDN